MQDSKKTSYLFYATVNEGGYKVFMKLQSDLPKDVKKINFRNLPSNIGKPYWSCEIILE
jgi:hypothetical protein